jgi:hypothetical protein
MRNCAPGCGHVHFSTLKYMAQSPKHYHHAVTVGIEDTTQLMLGRVVHALVLEDEPEQTFVVWDEGIRRGKAWDLFKNDHRGLDIVKPQEIEDARGMAAAVKASPAAMFLLDGQHEVTIDWEFMGRRCRGRADDVRLDRPRLTELKTSYDVSPQRFPRIARNMQYFAQLPWYALGARAGGLFPPGAPFPDLYIVAVENKPPYDVTTFQMQPSAIEYGEKCYRLWVEQVAICEASNMWPGYGDGPHPLEMPEESFDFLTSSIGGAPFASE